MDCAFVSYKTVKLAILQMEVFVIHAILDILGNIVIKKVKASFKIVIKWISQDWLVISALEIIYQILQIN